MGPRRRRNGSLFTFATIASTCSTHSLCQYTPTIALSSSPVQTTVRMAVDTKWIHHSPRIRTICHAKLKKVASSFDLDEILSIEKELDTARDDDVGPSKKKGRRNPKKNDMKQKMKEKMKKERQEKQRVQQQMKMGSDGIEEDIDDDTSDVDYQALMESIGFSAYKIPSDLDGKRIDAVLVELLNKKDGADDSSTLGSTPNSICISRSQCGTLLSNKCVFVVAAEKSNQFLSALESNRNEVGADGSTGVPYSLVERFSSPIQRKSHPLETSSILLHPSRESLLSVSSSATLLSNLIPPTEIIAQKIPLDVLYEDEHMIVLNKRAGMVVHPAAGNWDGTMVNALAYYLMNESPFGAGEFFAVDAERAVGSTESNVDIANDDSDLNQNDAVKNSIATLRPGIVHRLDKGTTGVIVVAKTSEALATLSEAFAERKVKKQYLAVVIGNPGEDQWINKPIARHPVHRQRMRVVPDPSSSLDSRAQPRLTGAKSLAMSKPGKSALSHIHTVYHDGKLSVVEVQIATGRTHQIRVHLQDHGTPIYGDDVYCSANTNKALSLMRGITRPLLHAQLLEIDHPTTGERMVFEAEVADDMKGVIESVMPVAI